MVPGHDAACLSLVRYVPVLQDLFHPAPLSAGQWLLAAGAGFVTVPVVAVEKWVRRRRSTDRAANLSSVAGSGARTVQCDPQPRLANDLRAAEEPERTSLYGHCRR